VKKVLVLGCSHAEVPVVRALQSREVFVGVAGSDSNGLAFLVADTAHLADYSDHREIRGIVESNEYETVIAGCNDFAAFTRTHLGDLFVGQEFDTVEQTEVIHHKDRFRTLCVEYSIPSPRAQVVDGKSPIHDQVSDLAWPLIVKPTDLTGGKGMGVCTTHSELDLAVHEALGTSRRDSVVVEEFVDGQLRSACYWLTDGRPRLLVHADEFMFRNPYLVSAALSPSLASSENLNALTKTIWSLCRIIGLSDGLLHVQYIANGDAFAILEVCRRPPGDLFIQLPTALGDKSISDLIVDHALGIRPQLPSGDIWTQPTLRLCLMTSRNGQIESWGLSQQFHGYVSEMTPLRSMRTEVSNYMVEKLGIAFASSPDRQELVGFALNPMLALDIRYAD